MISGVNTTNLSVAVLPPVLQVAVISTSPSFFPVTTPFSSTSAISGAELDHVTDLSVASTGYIFALSCAVFPFLSCCVPQASFPLQLMDKLLTGITTLTVHLAFLLPSTVMAVITAVPSFNVSMYPPASIETTLSSELVHATFLLFAS